MFDRNSFQHGYTCYSYDNEKIGTISDVGATHFKCDTGFLGLGKDFYIPFTSVDHVEGDRVYLNVSKDRLNQMNWDRQPVGWMS